MALARRGGAPADVEERRLLGDEQRFHPNAVGLLERGTALLKLTDYGAADLRAIHAALARGASVMVHVFGPPWVKRLPPGLSSHFGALCAPGEAGPPLHAVLLVASGNRCVFALDPWNGPDGQPIEVGDEELLASLCGYASMVIEAVR